MNLSELQDKDIIDMTTGENVGRIVDVEIDNSGQIVHFVAERKKIFMRNFRSQELSFTFKDISKIGADVILIRNVV